MTALSPQRLDALEQAAHWYSVLSDDADGDSYKAWSEWLQQSEDHRWAWEHAQALQQRMQGLPTAGRRTLALASRQQVHRRQVLKGLLLAAGIGALGWEGERRLQQNGWWADYRSGAHERPLFRLEDGSQLQLNSDSAVDIAFDEHRRLLHLRRGEILVDTGEASRRRPFYVVSAQGRIETLGGRFSVCQQEDTCEVAVYAQEVRIHPNNGDRQTLGAGQRCYMDNLGASHPQALRIGQDAWTRGLLVANEERLDEFLQRLQQHRSGWLQCDPRIAGLRISGTFDLDDTEQALRALVSSLPVDIEWRTRLWARVIPRV